MTDKQFFSDIKHCVASKEEIEIAKTFGRFYVYEDDNIGKVSVAIYKNVMYIIDIEIYKED